MISGDVLGYSDFYRYNDYDYVAGQFLKTAREDRDKLDDDQVSN